MTHRCAYCPETYGKHIFTLHKYRTVRVLDSFALLRDHLRNTHQLDKTFECFACTDTDHQFFGASEDQMKDHYRTRHGFTADQKFTCIVRYVKWEGSAPAAGTSSAKEEGEKGEKVFVFMFCT